MWGIEVEAWAQIRAPSALPDGDSSDDIRPGPRLPVGVQRADHFHVDTQRHTAGERQPRRNDLKCPAVAQRDAWERHVSQLHVLLHAGACLAEDACPGPLKRARSSPHAARFHA